MKEQKNASSSPERFVPAQYVCPDSTIETYPEYMVSNYGKVVSMKGKVMKILKPWRLKYGYLNVWLYIDGKHHPISVHRLVLSSFYPERYFSGAEVDHIDRDPKNNSIENLRWVTASQNVTNRDVVKPVKVTYLDDMHTEVFDSMRECSRAFGKSKNWCETVIRKQNSFNRKYNIFIEKIDHVE